MRWFTSDTHFSHANIISLCDRPFFSADQMNEVLIGNWNAVVSPSDVVFHLGDVALGKIADSLPLVGRLNGHKILIPGNHDRMWGGNADETKHEKKQNDRLKWRAEYLKYFNAIWPEQSKTHIGVQPFMLSHLPYRGDSQADERYADRRPNDRGLPLICGHVHGAWKHNGNQFNVGVDVNDFTPVSETEILLWSKTLRG